MLIVARDHLARAGLAALLGQQPGFAVVGQVAEDPDFQSSLRVYRPDVVVWDLGWDPAAALESLARMPEDAPPALALLPDETCAPDVWAAGVRGLLLRDTDVERLLVALVAVGQGFVVLDSSLAGAAPVVRGRPPAQVPEFTGRELEVLRLLAEGLPNKAIASRLGISEHTVKFHVNSVLGKLDAQSRTEAVTRAWRLGLILF